MSESSRYPVELQPLQKSFKNDELERELIQMFMDLVEKHIRPRERDLNVMGMPHLGSFNLVSRFVEEDGLALINNDDEPAMRYLHKAWKARNPKRGFHFLETYLQLLFPNSWKVQQLWNPKDLMKYPYPAHSDFKHIAEDSGDVFLTSRVRVNVYKPTNRKDYLDIIEPAIRSALPARFVIEMVPYVPLNKKFTMANYHSVGSTHEGSLKPDAVQPNKLASKPKVAQLANAGTTHKDSFKPKHVNASPNETRLQFANQGNIAASHQFKVKPKAVSAKGLFKPQITSLISITASTS